MTTPLSVVMLAEPGVCAGVQALVRASLPPGSLDARVVMHLNSCASCRRSATEYATMTGELRALRGWRGAEDPGLVEAIAKRVDSEIGRRLRRTWAIATVAGGLVVAGAAGVATHVARGRVGVVRAG